MTPKSTKFSLCLRIHREFFRSHAELLREGKERDELFDRLESLRTDRMSQMSKTSVLYLITAIAATQISSGATIQLRSPFFEVDIPKIYVITISAYLWWVMTMQFLAMTQYVLIVASVSNNFTEKSRFNSLKRLLKTQNDSSDLTSPLRYSGFVKYGIFDTMGIGVTYLAPIMLFAVPMLIATIGVWIELSLVFSNSVGWTIEWGLTIVSIGCFFCSITYTTMYFMPMRIRKDSTYILDAFLVPIGLGKERP